MFESISSWFQRPTAIGLDHAILWGGLEYKATEALGRTTRAAWSSKARWQKSDGIVIYSDLKWFVVIYNDL